MKRLLMVVMFVTLAWEYARAPEFYAYVSCSVLTRIGERA